MLPLQTTNHATAEEKMDPHRPRGHGRPQIILKMWIHASTEGHKLFKKCGFTHQLKATNYSSKGGLTHQLKATNYSRKGGFTHQMKATNYSRKRGFTYQPKATNY